MTEPIANLDYLLDPAEVAAPQLLGWRLSGRGVTLRIVEVEAYGGPADPASHAAVGPTRRNKTMFGPPARLYVYRSYGIHLCANVVTGPEGTGAAVLLRAGEIESGTDLARERRGRSDPVAELASGPGRLGAALGLRINDDNCDLTSGPYILLPPTVPVTTIRTGPRVGITRAAELPWRFWDADSSAVSRFRSGARR